MAKHAALRPRSINEWRKVPALSPPWPILARRLTLSGVNPEVRLQGRRVLIRRIDKAKELQRGHAKRSKFKTLIISSITVAAILIITAIPNSSPKKPADTRGKRIVENVCGIDSISAQLLGREPLTSVTLGESSVERLNAEVPDTDMRSD